MVKTFALVRSGIVYLGLRMALFMVWLGSMHIRIFPCGFSLTRRFESQSVVSVTVFMMPSLVKRVSLTLHLLCPASPWELDALGRALA